MSESVNLLKLRGDKDDSFIYAQSISSQSKSSNSIQLMLIDGSKAFICSIMGDDLEKMGKERRIDDIGAWAKEAFSSSNTNFRFSITKEEGLTFKKVGDEKSKVKIRVGPFPVEEISFEDAQGELIDNAITNIDDMRSKYSELTSRHNKLLADLRESQSKLKEFGQEKAEVEKKLYEQFLPVLQSKQDKIAELTAELETKGEKSKRGDDDEEYGSDTDVDEAPMKKSKSGDDIESSSKSLLDDSQNFLNI